MYVGIYPNLSNFEEQWFITLYTVDPRLKITNINNKKNIEIQL
jgi:hypothetical protein